MSAMLYQIFSDFISCNFQQELRFFSNKNYFLKSFNFLVDMNFEFESSRADFNCIPNLLWILNVNGNALIKYFCPKPHIAKENNK